MNTRVTRPTSTSPSPLSRVRAGLVARREARLKEQELVRALAGDLGPGVQADVWAALSRSAWQHGSAA